MKGHQGLNPLKEAAPVSNTSQAAFSRVVRVNEADRSESGQPRPFLYE